ncbi:MAG TPA: hypothetical protein GXX14_07070 [Clostridiaceae bacterium]|nr:hypothetical protein [Clostridiaceae bacterium]
MNNSVLIKGCTGKYSELVINPRKAVMLNLEKKKFAILSFGSQKHYVSIKIDNDVPEEHIMLSRRLIEKMHIPDYPIYEIAVDKNEIKIGPFIGLLVAEEGKYLTTSCLNKMLDYVREYSKLHGAVVVFALDKVDTANLQIEGYCFNPNTNNWQRGIFPYPQSIYRTVGLSGKWKNHFLSIIGDKIFNSRYFSKWDLYQWLSKNNEIGHHLPCTSLYRSYQDVLDLVEMYGKIYIKPVYGLQGRGIVQVSKNDDTFVFKYREDGVNHSIELKDLGEAIDFLQKRFYDGRYLIQQALELIEFKGGKIDFRCIMQKNQAGVWVCKAVIGRRGERGSVVSNISSGGTALPAIDALSLLFSADKKVVYPLKEKIEFFAIKVCNALDELGG